jgi:uncharacterized protein (DUF2267 family)
LPRTVRSGPYSELIGEAATWTLSKSPGGKRERNVTHMLGEQPEADDHITVDIALPLPSDVVTTLINVVGLAYPGTMIDVSGERVRTEREMLRLRIPQGERNRDSASREAIANAKRCSVDEHEATLTSFRDTLAAQTPQQVSEILGSIAAQIFVDNPTALNYVQTEMSARDPADQHRYVVIVAKSDGQTPHALRRKAEIENERLRARITELECARAQP